MASGWSDGKEHLPPPYSPLGALVNPYALPIGPVPPITASAPLERQGTVWTGRTEESADHHLSVVREENTRAYLSTHRVPESMQEGYVNCLRKIPYRYSSPTSLPPF